MTCCSDTTTATPQSASLDPTKHVNYALGMVLGEDDFKQEFAYLSNRDHWLARDLIGYGTVRGLRLRIDRDGDKGPRIFVDNGVALSPRGQLICVPNPQCANINLWLAKHPNEVVAHVGSPPSNLSLYVVLCYRACPTDDVPLPGEPCRTEDQLTKPSRLTDDFCIELRFEPPKHREEFALRDFCQWLRQVPMNDATVTSTPLANFLDAIRQAAAPWLSPPISSPPTASPPDDFMFGFPAGLTINPIDACDYLRAAFRIWVTELRPKWIERWYGCAPSTTTVTPTDDCVLLGEIRVALVPDGAGGFKADDNTLPSPHEEQRPFVVHLRMLQEWLLCGRCASAPTAIASPPTVTSSNTGPAPGDNVVPENTFGMPANAGSSLAYSRADHTHGTPPLSASGQFVERAVQEAYSIVAAGSLSFPITVSPSPTVEGNEARILSKYNNLRVLAPYNGSRGGFRISFDGFKVGRNYVVKITPWAPKGSGSGDPFNAYFSDFAPNAGSLAAGFYVTISLNRTVSMTEGRLMIEVSEIGK